MLKTAKRVTKPGQAQLSVWLASSCAEARFAPTPLTAEHRFEASAPAGDHCAGLLYVNQHASGGSFVAGLEGQITPGPGTELVLKIGVPPILDAPECEAELLRAVVAGFENVPREHRPVGSLELTRFCVHPADFKTHRWRLAASLLCRLTSREMTSLLERNASEAELWTTVERLCPNL